MFPPSAFLLEYRTVRHNDGAIFLPWTGYVKGLQILRKNKKTNLFFIYPKESCISCITTAGTGRTLNVCWPQDSWYISCYLGYQEMHRMLGSRKFLCCCKTIWVWACYAVSLPRFTAISKCVCLHGFACVPVSMGCCLCKIWTVWWVENHSG